MTNRAGRPGRPKPAAGWIGWASPGWLLVLGVWLGSLLNVALNTATNTSTRYPGPLRLLQQYPWQTAMLLTLILGVLAWRQHQHAATTQPQGGGPLTEVITGPRAAPPTAAELARLRRELLEQVHRTWIQGVLDRSLAQVTRVELGLTEQPSAVDQPWGALLHQPGQPDQVWPPGTRISTVADRFDWQLLILGAPGAGKTTVLLEYARDLLQHAKRDATAPIPVVFHLSAWPDKPTSLAEWLVKELALRYGVSRRLADELVDRDRLAVLLDGLDEVPADRQAACVEAINAFRGDHGGVPLVVCARTRDYQNLKALRLKGAVAVQPLDRAQIADWLAAAGRPLAGLRAALRDRDHWLWALLDSPLRLSIAGLTYKDQPASAIRAHGSEESLLGAYVEATLTRPRAPLAAPPDQVPYAHADTLRWLGWLAKQMGAESVFYPDWMQPDWLPTRPQQWLATTGLGLVPALTAGLLSGVIVGLSAGLIAGLVAGLVVGLLMRLTRHNYQIEPVEPRRWSWTSARSGLLIGLIAGPLIGLGLGLALGLTNGLRAGLFAGVGVGLVLALGVVVEKGLKPQVSVRPAAPLQGIHAAAQTGRTSGLVLGLLLALAAVLIAGPPYGLGVGLIAGIVLGVAGGLDIGLTNGGDSYLRHRLLVWLLRRQGLIPADLIGFLDYADSRILLRRAGGGYLFIHRLLQDYFANPAHQTNPPRATDTQQVASVQ
jgi:hypothetical protein